MSAYLQQCLPRFISCARIENGYLALPRGCLDDAIALLQEQNISPLFDDKREIGKPLLCTRQK